MWSAVRRKPVALVPRRKLYLSPLLLGDKARLSLAGTQRPRQHSKALLYHPHPQNHSPNTPVPSKSGPAISATRMSVVPGAQALLTWIAAHPYQTCFHVVNGVVLLTPAAATVPIFSALGLSAGGPVSGSAAAYIMSYFNYVPAGGLYATAQSAAMGGYGAAIAAGAAQAGAVASSTVAWMMGRR